ncbi:TPA: chitin-binding protein, partial [Providencia stuartii]|nr:chitin-binding protein [Providencia stuartii]
MRTTFIAISMLFLSMSALADNNVLRHGYIDNPPSRAFLCS